MWKKISLTLCGIVLSGGSWALPATFETAKEVLKVTNLDQTIHFYQREDDLDKLATAFLQGVSHATNEDYSAYQPQVVSLLRKHIQSPEFKAYYELQLMQPYLEIYQEEELVHLLQLYEHPQAQSFFRQAMLSLQDHLQQEDEQPISPKDNRQREQRVAQLLNQLGPSPQE